MPFRIFNKYPLLSSFLFLKRAVCRLLFEYYKFYLLRNQTCLIYLYCSRYWLWLSSWKSQRDGIGHYQWGRPVFFLPYYFELSSQNTFFLVTIVDMIKPTMTMTWTLTHTHTLMTLFPDMEKDMFLVQSIYDLIGKWGVLERLIFEFYDNKIIPMNDHLTPLFRVKAWWRLGWDCRLRCFEIGESL